MHFLTLFKEMHGFGLHCLHFMPQWSNAKSPIPDGGFWHHMAQATIQTELQTTKGSPEPMSSWTFHVVVEYDVYFSKYPTRKWTKTVVPKLLTSKIISTKSAPGSTGARSLDEVDSHLQKWGWVSWVKHAQDLASITVVLRVTPLTSKCLNTKSEMQSGSFQFHCRAGVFSHAGPVCRRIVHTNPPKPGEVIR